MPDDALQLAFNKAAEVAREVTAAESAALMIATMYSIDDVPANMKKDLHSGSVKMVQIGWLLFCQMKALEPAKPAKKTATKRAKKQPARKK